MPLREVQRRFPDLWEANLRQDDPKFRWPGGESYIAFRRRCIDTLHRIVTAHRGGSVALITHAGVISQVIGFLFGTGPAEWERFRAGNTAVTELVWESGDLLFFNDRSHLPHELT